MKKPPQISHPQRLRYGFAKTWRPKRRRLPKAVDFVLALLIANLALNIAIHFVSTGAHWLLTWWRA